jgi:hypothetical protein
MHQAECAGVESERPLTGSCAVTGHEIGGELVQLDEALHLATLAIKVLRRAFERGGGVEMSTSWRTPVWSALGCSEHSRLATTLWGRFQLPAS